MPGLAAATVPWLVVEFAPIKIGIVGTIGQSVIDDIAKIDKALASMQLAPDERAQLEDMREQAQKLIHELGKVCRVGEHQVSSGARPASSVVSGFQPSVFAARVASLADLHDDPDRVRAVRRSHCRRLGRQHRPRPQPPLYR